MKDPSGLIRGDPSGPSGIKWGGIVVSEAEDCSEDDWNPGLLDRTGLATGFFRLK